MKSSCWCSCYRPWGASIAAKTNLTVVDSWRWICCLFEGRRAANWLQFMFREGWFWCSVQCRSFVCKWVCVKLFLETMLVEETIDEGILLTLLNTSGATPECYGIVSLQESSDFHPFAIVQDVIKCGLEGRDSLTLEELLDPSNLERSAPNWSALEAELRYRLQLVHNCGVAMNDISLKNILLQWNGKSYIPFFIDMGLAKYRDDSFYDHRIDRDQLEKIFEEHFPKPTCVYM